MQSWPTEVSYSMTYTCKVSKLSQDDHRRLATNTRGDYWNCYKNRQFQQLYYSERRSTRQVNGGNWTHTSFDEERRQASMKKQPSQTGLPRYLTNVAFQFPSVPRFYLPFCCLACTTCRGKISIVSIASNAVKNEGRHTKTLHFCLLFGYTIIYRVTAILWPVFENIGNQTKMNLPIVQIHNTSFVTRLLSLLSNCSPIQCQQSRTKNHWQFHRPVNGFIMNIGPCKRYEVLTHFAISWENVGNQSKRYSHLFQCTHTLVFPVRRLFLSNSSMKASEKQPAGRWIARKEVNSIP